MKQGVIQSPWLCPEWTTASEDYLWEVMRVHVSLLPNSADCIHGWLIRHTCSRAATGVTKAPWDDDDTARAEMSSGFSRTTAAETARWCDNSRNMAKCDNSTSSRAYSRSTKIIRMGWYYRNQYGQSDIIIWIQHVLQRKAAARNMVSRLRRHCDVLLRLAFSRRVYLRATDWFWSKSHWTVTFPGGPAVRYIT